MFDQRKLRSHYWQIHCVDYFQFGISNQSVIAFRWLMQRSENKIDPNWPLFTRCVSSLNDKYGLIVITVLTGTVLT